MRILQIIAWTLLAPSLAACSSIPTLQETTGASDPGPFIRQVVERIKCEITETAISLKEEDKYIWTQGWQAKVNLTLAITNSGGLTPNVQTVNFLPSAFYNATSATGATLLQAVQQKFTFGASLNHTESASRSELITFTVAFGDLVKGGSKETCPQEGSGLQGNLGLKDWVTSAFVPVEQGTLLAGRTDLKPRKEAAADKFETALCKLHPEEKKSDGCKKFFPTLESTDLVIRWKAAKYLDDFCVDEAFLTFYEKELKSYGYKPKFHEEVVTLEMVRDHQHSFTKLKLKFQETIPCENIDELFNRKGLATFQDTVSAIKKSVAEARRHYKNNIEPFHGVIHSNDATVLLKKAILQAKRAEQLLNIYETAFRSPKFSEPIGGCYLKSPPTDVPHSYEKCKDAYKKLIDAATLRIELEDFKSAVEDIQAYVESFRPQRPIDSLSHTITFAVTNSAGIQPNWTLIQLNGPLTQLANAQGLRTHTLVIAVGPTEENKTNIQNQTVLSTRSPQ